MSLFRKKGGAANRRRVERIPERHAMLVLDGVSYGVVDWSIEGFRVLGYRGGLARGDEAHARLIIVHKGLPVHFDATVRVDRESSETGEIAGQFTKMSTATRTNLERVYGERLAKLHEKAAGGERV